MLEKRLTSTKLVINLRGVHMLFLSTLVTIGCGTVWELVVGLMEASVILTLTQVQSWVIKGILVAISKVLTLWFSYAGVFSFLSYRDPNLLKTLDVYDGTSDFLRELEVNDDTLTKAIIGTIGDVDSYQLPDAKGYSRYVGILPPTPPLMELYLGVLLMIEFSRLINRFSI